MRYSPVILSFFQTFTIPVEHFLSRNFRQDMIMNDNELLDVLDLFGLQW